MSYSGIFSELIDMDIKHLQPSVFFVYRNYGLFLAYLSINTLQHLGYYRHNYKNSI